MTNRMNRRGMLAVMGGLALVGLAAAAPGDAGVDTNRTTQLTFSKPFSLPGVTLAAGTYIFERAAPQSAIEVVRVSSRDRRFVYYTGFTELVEKAARATPRRSPSVRRRQGPPVPVREWYPTGTSTGHRFLLSVSPGPWWAPGSLGESREYFATGWTRVARQSPAGRQCATDAMCSRSRSRPKSLVKSRHTEWMWLPLFWVLSYSIRNVGP